jgi:hypothetical protein
MRGFYRARRRRESLFAMSHLDDVRRLQRELEDELPATGLSVDGRSFSFRAPIGGAALPAGSYVALHGDGAIALGHVVSSELSFREVEYRGARETAAS